MTAWPAIALRDLRQPDAHLLTIGALHLRAGFPRIGSKRQMKTCLERCVLCFQGCRGQSELQLFRLPPMSLCTVRLTDLRSQQPCVAL